MMVEYSKPTPLELKRLGTLAYLSREARLALFDLPAGQAKQVIERHSRRIMELKKRGKL